MTSTSNYKIHAAIIMDGNGRWAAARGLPRIAGHKAGVQALRRSLEAAPGLGIGCLTVYAFSSDNWKRPPSEVSALMGMLRAYLETEVDECVRNGIRVSLIGRRDRLPGMLLPAIEAAETATAAGDRLHLRIAVDYSSRDRILDAVSRLKPDATRADLAALLEPDVDLVIRTGGEQRLSDFLLWESAYAELVFTPRMWPEFDAATLAAAVADFRSRDRRFGAVPQPAEATA